MSTKISKTTQWKLLVTLFFLLLNGVLLFTLTQGVMAETRALSEQQEKELQEAQLLLIKEKEMETGKLNLEKLKEEVKDFDQQVPLQLDTPQIAFDFYTFTLDHQLIPEVITFGEVQALVEEKGTKKDTEKNEETLYALDVEYSLRGTAEHVEAFLADLSKITTARLALKNLVLDNADNGELELRLTFTHFSRSESLAQRTYSSYSFKETLAGRETLEDLFASPSSGSAPLTLPES